MKPARVGTLLAFAAVAALAATACSPVETGEIELQLEVPGTLSISAGEPGQLALRNQGTAALFVPMGMYVSRERLTGGGWVSLGPWFIVDGAGPSLRVGPGESLENSIHVLYFREQGPGTYRFRYEIYSDAGLKRPLPAARRVSETFEVTQ